MAPRDTAYPSVVSEKELRRQIDRSVSRALVDSDYARVLLNDPSVVIEDRGCSPQHYLSLRSIEATSLLDFARQARALFWTLDASEHRELFKDDQRTLPAAA